MGIPPLTIGSGHMTMFGLIWPFPRRAASVALYLVSVVSKGLP
jgi:hypothetical protein